MTEPRGSGLGAFGGPRGALVATSLMALFGASTQIMPASILPLAMPDLGIGPSAAGWLVSATLLAQSFVSLPIGYAFDRYDTRHVVLVGTAIIVCGNVWSWVVALEGSFLWLVVSRLFTGVGIATLWTGGATIVGSTFTGDNAATATGVYTASAPLGYAVAQFVSPVVAAQWRWETNFLLYAAASAAAFLLFALLAYRTADTSVEGARTTLEDFGYVVRNRAVWYVAFMAFAGYSLNLFFNSWMPTYLTSEFGFDLASSGLLIALFPAMGVVARTSGGVISDRFLGGRRRPVPLVAFLVTTPLVVVMYLVQTPLLIAALLVLSGYFVQVGIGLFYTLVSELVAENVTGSAIAVLTTMSFVGGFSAPIIAGVLIERTGAYVAAFAFALGLSVLGVAFAVAVPEPGGDDAPSRG